MTTTAYSYTGTFDTFVVPGGVTVITVDLYGAQGGPNGGGFQGGALGGRVKCDVTVTPGETLRIYVGGRPPASSLVPGYNGGSLGGTSGAAGDAGGGGGGTDIRRSPYALADRLVIAGGGGGTGGNDNKTNAGGTGRTPIGGTGTVSDYGAKAGGTGGTTIAGGTGYNNGAIGSGANAFPSIRGGGGGGGGRYGGGSGIQGSTGQSGGGGGGGSGLSTGIAETIVDGTRSGDGYAEIIYTLSSAIAVEFAASVELTIAELGSDDLLTSRRNRPRRSYVWVAGVDGTQQGVIR